MASKDRTSTHDLITRLSECPWSFDFFLTVRRLNCANPTLPVLGTSRRLADDAVRFGQQPDMRFAPATFHEVHTDGKYPAPRIHVHFFGMLGPNGPLPLHLTVNALHRKVNLRDETFPRFLDIFNHRLICLHYRAWASSRPTVSRDRPEHDRFSAFIGSLGGLGQRSLLDRDHVQDDAKRRFTGHLAGKTRHADGLASILSEYFGVTTIIEQFIGKWVSVPVSDQLVLGRERRSALIGRSAVLGRRIYDHQQRFRIVFGPLSWSDYQRFLPVGRSFRRVADWVKQYTMGVLEWELRLVLQKEEVPCIRLGIRAGEENRLGWTTWIDGKQRHRDADDLVLQTRWHD